MKGHEHLILRSAAVLRAHLTNDHERPAWPDVDMEGLRDEHRFIHEQADRAAAAARAAAEAWDAPKPPAPGPDDFDVTLQVFATIEWRDGQPVRLVIESPDPRVRDPPRPPRLLL